MRALSLVLSVCFLTACGGVDDSQTSNVDEATGTTTDVTPAEPEGPAPAALAAVTNGTCPDLSTAGTIVWQSNGNQRSVITVYPAEMTDNMPLVFVWHPLGGNAAMMVNYLQLQRFADQHQVIMVVPDLREGAQTWGFYGNPSDDLAVYDDMRTCMSEQQNIDLYKVSTTGMSAGGLWSTYLVMHRADSLATALIMSGGTDPLTLPYKTPTQNIPVLVTWGGTNDTWGQGSYLVEFEKTTMNFRENLTNDGHYVVGCNHGRGHTIPTEAGVMSELWLLNHTYGKPSPFLESIEGFPSYCEGPM
jgi:poly(3-hydroxybutyrate) depolymerase